MSQYAEFPATTSNGVISETKSFLAIFYCGSEMYIKFEAIWRKSEPSSLSILGIIDSKGSVYLNV